MPIISVIVILISLTFLLYLLFIVFENFIIVDNEKNKTYERSSENRTEQSINNEEENVDDEIIHDLNNENDIYDIGDVGFYD